MKWLTSLLGQRIAVTGQVWCGRPVLSRRLGAKATPGGRVTADTTLLIKGKSPFWRYGDYGRKERRVAELLRRGQPIAVVHDFEFRKLLENGRRARLCDYIAGQPVEWLISASKRQFLDAAAVTGPLDRERNALGRVEQSFLRHSLFGNAEEYSCSLCGRRLPTELLVAAHIKPRSECSRRERLDFVNVAFGLCLLGCDALYEHGLVSVRPGGKICISAFDGSRALKQVLRVFRGRTCASWNSANAHYFEWHATRHFQG